MSADDITDGNVKRSLLDDLMGVVVLINPADDR